MTKCAFRKFEYTPTMHTHQKTRGYRICLGTYAKACESRLWSHTSSSEGWSIRRALGLGSCGRDGRAYLIDPPQYLATSEFLRRWAASTSRRVRRLLALRQVCMFGGVSIPPKNPWDSSTFSYRDSAESEPYPLILNRGLWRNAREAHSITREGYEITREG